MCGSNPKSKEVFNKLFISGVLSWLWKDDSCGCCRHTFCSQVFPLPIHIDDELPWSPRSPTPLLIITDNILNSQLCNHCYISTCHTHSLYSTLRSLLIVHLCDIFASSNFPQPFKGPPFLFSLLLSSTSL